MVLTVLRWLWRRFRPAEGRAMFALLLGAALSAALGAMAARWVVGDELFLHTAVVAVLVARALTATRVRGWRAALLRAAAGLLYVGWWVTHLRLPVWGMLGAAWHGDRALLESWLREAQARVGMLTGELGTWARSWIGLPGTPGPVVSLFWMAFIVWSGAAFASWMVTRRRHPLVSFLPLGGALALSVYLADQGSRELMVFLACVVMMIPLGTLRSEREAWESRQVPYPELVQEETFWAALIATTVFLVGATVLPDVRIRAVVDWFWRLAQRPQQASETVLSRAFPGVRSPAAHDGLPGTVGAVLPREHLIGGSPQLRETVVMLVSTDDAPPLAEELGTQIAGARQTFYWRGTVYSEYVGAGWKRGQTRVTGQQPYVSIEPSGRLGRRPLRQEFDLLVSHGETLYAAGDPSSVNQPVMVRRQRDSGDPMAMEGAFDRYQVLSLVPDVTEQQLSEVGTEYPRTLAWVYRTLPDSLPQRITDLALEVTAKADTIYQQALALEAYLRSIPYDLNVPKAPQGRDVVDYFLFELQRGYCDYFASSMVVMARAVGIPARLAVGYAMGQYDSLQGAYVVAALDAHAWPELYFVDHGWIPFEPTPAFGPFDRSQATVPKGSGALVLPSLPPRSWWVRLQVESRVAWLRWRGRLAGIGAVLAVLVVSRWVWRGLMLGLSAEARVSLAYVRLRSIAPRLRVAVAPSDTPAEFAAAMQRGLVGRRARWPRGAQVLQREVEQALEAVRLVTWVYELLSYAPTAPDLTLVRNVWRSEPWLRWRLWRVWALSSSG